jgi:hypothetical protein
MHDHTALHSIGVGKQQHNVAISTSDAFHKVGTRRHSFAKALGQHFFESDARRRAHDVVLAPRHSTCDTDC